MDVDGDWSSAGSNRAYISGNASVQGGLSVGGTTDLQSNVGISGQVLMENASNSTIALQVANASGVSLLTADTTHGTVIVGNGSNTVTLSSSGIALAGTARYSEKIVLTPEYAGAVLYCGGSSCPTNDIGTMTSGYDSTRKENYYQWTTSQGSNQAYDIVAQIPIPTNYSAWASSTPLTVDVNTSDTTNGTVLGTLLDTSGTAVTNWSTCSLTPSVTGWVTSGAGATNGATCDITSGTWTPGGVATLVLQLQAPTSGTTEVGDIVLNYLASF